MTAVTDGSTAPASRPGAGMRFNVDGWDPSYGVSSQVEELPESVTTVNAAVEVDPARWAPIDPPADGVVPSAVLFVDGVRRIDARIWIDDPAPSGDRPSNASAGICASYAAGVVCCCDSQAHLIAAEVRRGLFTVAPHAVTIDTAAGSYAAVHTVAREATPLAVTLSNALQQSLADVEVTTAVAARAQVAGHGVGEDNLLVIDGPLRGRAHLPRALGFIKTHRTEYLPDPLNPMVAALRAGQRTPVFLMGGSWDRHSWYLRLPGAPGAPWAGIVRIEAPSDLSVPELTALAKLSQTVLCRFASVEYKDPRAPQNLVPIGGLEKTLRHRLADPRLLYRALRAASA